ncbi:hypothetical protein DAI22_05g087500 [Oryza sativa Japonica Group]|nr:hypothetical protein DAI22_05g087500 [Oryza sativa Japonica Group]
MPPKRKSPAAGSPRKTRSMAVGKQWAEAPAKAAKKEAAAPDTQCRQFKIRAVKVKEDLESFVPGVSVVINPEKPRRGCLEIREEGGEVFISLLNMPRPFTAMKKLDMDEVIKDIAK